MSIEAANSPQAPREREPQGDTLTLQRPDTVRPRIKYVPSRGEMQRVYIGPPGEQPDIVNLEITKPFTRKAGPFTEDTMLVQTDYAPPIKDKEMQLPEPDPTVLYSLPPTPNPVYDAPESVEYADNTPQWHTYPKEGLVTLFGRSDAKRTYWANRNTLRAMAKGKVPVPAELSDVVEQYKVSSLAGRKAFEKYYNENR
jgi:hypothetical protein